MKAFILAAGLGTRLKPFTDHHPKALAPVNGDTLLGMNIKKLKQIGISDIIINVHHFADQIKQYLQNNDNFGCNVFLSDEQHQVLETGGGILNAKELYKDDAAILVMNVDILSNIDLEKLIFQHQATNAAITLAVTNRVASRQLLFDQQEHCLLLRGWRNNTSGAEKIPNPIDDSTQLVPYSFSGIQLINTSALELVKMEGKFSSIDMYLELCNQIDIQAFDHSGDILLDVGKPESLTLAATLFSI